MYFKLHMYFNLLILPVIYSGVETGSVHNGLRNVQTVDVDVYRLAIGVFEPVVHLVGDIHGVVPFASVTHDDIDSKVMGVDLSLGIWAVSEDEKLCSQGGLVCYRNVLRNSIRFREKLERLLKKNVQSCVRFLRAVQTNCF